MLLRFENGIDKVDVLAFNPKISDREASPSFNRSFLLAASTINGRNQIAPLPGPSRGGGISVSKIACLSAPSIIPMGGLVFVIAHALEFFF